MYTHRRREIDTLTTSNRERGLKERDRKFTSNSSPSFSIYKVLSLSSSRWTLIEIETLNFIIEPGLLFALPNRPIHGNGTWAVVAHNSWADTYLNIILQNVLTHQIRSSTSSISTWRDPYGLWQLKRLILIHPLITPLNKSRVIHNNSNSYAPFPSQIIQYF